MTDEKRITVSLALAATCPDCHQQRAVKASGLCPECGANLPSDEVEVVREAVSSRRRAFKRRLATVDSRLHTATDAPLVFETRGTPQSRPDYLDELLQPATRTIRDRHGAVKRLLATGEWNPDDPACIATFTALVRALDAEIDFTVQLRQTMPPLELRGVHRELTRASVQFVRGHVAMARTICAIDADEATGLAKDATAALDEAARHLQRTWDLLGLVERNPSADPFHADGSLDVAAFVWSVVALKTSSVKDAAALARAAFADMPDVPRLSDHHAVLLLPMLAVGAGVIDPEVLSERVQQLRNVLDSAGAPAAWVTQPNVLVSRVGRGIERFADEIARLGLEARYGLPRSHIMRSQTDVYRNLVEGTLRDLGGLVLVAARASRGEADGTYETDVIDGMKAGEIVSELERMGAPCGGAVKMIYRNASAHADVEVTDTGICVTERRIEHGREVSRDPQSLSDDEFAEDMVALQEILLALELTVLPWLWATSDRGLAVAVAGAPVTRRQPYQTIALLGGMAGLYDLSLTIDGSSVIIKAAAHKDKTDRRETQILALVPAALGISADIQKVSLAIGGLSPVEFDRVEFLGNAPDEVLYKLPMIALTTARWMLESGTQWTKRDEATYVTFPLTELFFACCDLAGSTPPRTENIDQAVSALQLVLSRLDTVVPEERRSGLTCETVELNCAFAESLTGIAESRRGLRTPAEGERLGKEIAATLEPMFKIQKAAKTLRDG